MNVAPSNKYHLEILSELRRHVKGASESDIEWIRNYIGTTKPCHPIGTEIERQIVREWARKHPELSPIEHVGLLTSLFQGESSNEISMAGKILEMTPKLRSSISPHLLDTWLNSVEGWAEADSLCQSKFSADEILARWKEWKALLTKLASDRNVHKRRASLVLLTKPVRNSEDRRLADLAFINIDKLKKDRSILVTKAVSWLLRDLIKNHRKRVETYLNENKDDLPKIALRETRKKLSTGRK